VYNANDKTSPYYAMLPAQPDVTSQEKNEFYGQNAFSGTADSISTTNSQGPYFAPPKQFSAQQNTISPHQLSPNELTRSLPKDGRFTHQMSNDSSNRQFPNELGQGEGQVYQLPVFAHKALNVGTAMQHPNTPVKPQQEDMYGHPPPAPLYSTTRPDQPFDQQLLFPKDKDANQQYLQQMGYTSQPFTPPQPVTIDTQLKPETQDQPQPNARKRTLTETEDSKRRGPGRPKKPDDPGPRPVKSREPLTEDEKKANHVLSEQRRRNLIRSGFATLAELTPSLAGASASSHSKAAILEKSAEYVMQLQNQVRALSSVCARHGIQIQGFGNGGNGDGDGDV
jgi:Helix-loop-helix DNA-binding domain